MAGSSGDSDIGLQKIMDFTRLGSIVILLMHFYYFCYDAFKAWKLTSGISDRLLQNILVTGLFNGNNAKLLALALLIISLIGSKGRKDENVKIKSALFILFSGLLFYLFSYLSLNLNYSEEILSIVYVFITGLGYLFILAGGALLSRLI
ncbi:MAG: YWFCY domain-containing protein [Puia sp.]